MTSREPFGSSASASPTKQQHQQQQNKSRRKKNASSSITSSSRVASSSQGNNTSASIISAASRATRELSELRSEVDAKRNDTAWLSSDMVAIVSSSSDSSGVSFGLAGNESKVVESALKANGLERNDVTDVGYGCLLEYAKRYACEIFADAQDYARHSTRKEVHSVDLQLASEFRNSTNDYSFTENILTLAEEINRIPLPSIPFHCYHGIVLPPPELQLTSRTFDVVLNNGGTTPTSTTNKDNKKLSGSGTSYGAIKGKQSIQINIKSSNINLSSKDATQMNKTEKEEIVPSSTSLQSPTAMDVSQQDGDNSGIKRSIAEIS